MFIANLLRCARRLRLDIQCSRAGVPYVLHSPLDEGPTTCRTAPTSLCANLVCAVYCCVGCRAYYMPDSTNFVLLETPTSFIVAFRGSESLLHDWVSRHGQRVPLPLLTKKPTLLRCAMHNQSVTRLGESTPPAPLTCAPRTQIYHLCNTACVHALGQPDCINPKARWLSHALQPLSVPLRLPLPLLTPLPAAPTSAPHLPAPGHRPALRTAGPVLYPTDVLLTNNQSICALCAPPSHSWVPTCIHTAAPLARVV